MLLTKPGRMKHHVDRYKRHFAAYACPTAYAAPATAYAASATAYATWQDEASHPQLQATLCRNDSCLAMTHLPKKKMGDSF